MRGIMVLYLAVLMASVLPASTSTRVWAAPPTAIRLAPKPADRTTVGGLTTRQVEVLVLLADGLTNREISSRLFVSVKTVDHHVSAILLKLEASTRHEAVKVAREQGLV